MNLGNWSAAQWLIAYWLVVSLTGVVLTCYDKAVSVNGRCRRIPEKTLLWVGAAGGALVMYLTMRLIRHKTLHKKFMIGLPLLVLSQAALICGYFYLC